MSAHSECLKIQYKCLLVKESLKQHLIPLRVLVSLEVARKLLKSLSQ